MILPGNNSQRCLDQLPHLPPTCRWASGYLHSSWAPPGRRWRWPPGSPWSCKATRAPLCGEWPSSLKIVQKCLLLKSSQVEVFQGWVYVVFPDTYFISYWWTVLRGIALWISKIFHLSLQKCGGAPFYFWGHLHFWVVFIFLPVINFEFNDRISSCLRSSSFLSHLHFWGGHHFWVHPHFWGCVLKSLTFGVHEKMRLIFARSLLVSSIVIVRGNLPPMSTEYWNTRNKSG